MSEEQNIISENLDGNACAATQWETMKKEVLAAVDEKFDVEAVAQMVEQLDFSKKIDAKLQNACNSACRREGQNSFAIASLQNELRDVIMDVALLKRALVSMGQIGVMERKRIEKELVLELFSPKQVRPGLGIVVSQNQTANTAEEDCEKRVHICKQACCRIFDIHLNANEVESGKHDWNPRSPYSLHKNHKGCVNLVQGQCTIYQNRPVTCYTYSCQKDSRIWADYANMVLNPSLRQRLISTGLLSPDTPSPSEQSHVDSSALNSEFVKPVENISPPDFSKLREMTVAEPVNKFVPPPKEETCDAAS